MCPTPDELDRQTKAALYGPDYQSGSLPPAPPPNASLPRVFKPTIYHQRPPYTNLAPLPPAPAPVPEPEPSGWGCITFWLTVFLAALLMGIASLAYINWLAAGNPGWPELFGWR